VRIANTGGLASGPWQDNGVNATMAAGLLAGVLSAQEPTNVAAYRHAIDVYRDGVVPGASGVVDGADPAMAGRVLDGAAAWTAADLAAAAMLHSERALLLARRSSAQAAAMQVDAAVLLLRAALERDSAWAPFARRWRSAVAGLLEAAGVLDLAQRVASEPLPGLLESKAQAAARAEFARGLTEEIRAAVAGPLSGSPPKRVLPIAPETQRALLEAAKHYQAALTADPDDAEAALHLGRTLLVAGREAEADRPLRLAAAAPDRPVRYLAVMFLGAMAERQARYADAERDYLAALHTFPWGQSAALALSHVLMRQGREAEARAAVAGHFAGVRPAVVEPLWTYLADPATDLGPMLNLLRAEIWR
jgi:tetratricopeptide (TPR) repeat protein